MVVLLASVARGVVLGAETPLVVILSLCHITLVDASEIAILRNALKVRNSHPIEQCRLASSRFIGTHEPMLVTVGVVDQLGLHFHQDLLNVLRSLS